MFFKKIVQKAILQAILPKGIPKKIPSPKGGYWVTINLNYSYKTAYVDIEERRGLRKAIERQELNERKVRGEIAMRLLEQERKEKEERSIANRIKRIWRKVRGK
jgi:hypothetical protein